MLKILYYLSAMFAPKSLINSKLISLLALPLFAWFVLPFSKESKETSAPENINLALRRTGDLLLRTSGDNTSQIPPVEQVNPDVWRLKLDSEFCYEYLPHLLQTSLDLYNIKQPYKVTVRRCENNLIDLGYHQLDFLMTKSVPCQGRDMSEGCHYITISFIKNEDHKSLWNVKIGVVLFFGIFLTFLIRYVRQKNKLSDVNITDSNWLMFGNSRLNVTNQTLVCGNEHHTLTYRESKLLHLFVTNANQILERDFILKQVWEDEGVMVGRSVDVFVSRLRKKLMADPKVNISVVHGVGYRLETMKQMSD